MGNKGDMKLLFVVVVVVVVVVLPSISLWGFYSNSMHPSIITMYTFTHSFTFFFFYRIHFYVSANKVSGGILGRS